MNAIFSDAVAIVLQHIALPLETLGFTLTFIEVMNPDLADRIEASIDRFAELRDEKIFQDRFPYIGVLDIIWIVLFLGTSAGFLAIQIYYRPFSTMSYNAIAVGCTMAVVLPFIGVGTHLLLYGVMKLPSKLLHYLDEKSNGRALGGVGLILAFIGLMFELYQVLTIHLASWDADSIAALFASTHLFIIFVVFVIIWMRSRC